MNILIYSTKSAYAFSKIGGAESSLQLIAEKLADNGNKVVFITGKENWRLKYKPVVFKKVQVYFFPNFIDRLILIFFNKFLSSYQFIVFKKRLKKLLKETIIREKIDIVYTYYELDILKLFISVQRETKSFALVMRMAGLFWHEQIKKNSLLKAEYEQVFNSVDSINYISAGLLKLVNSLCENSGVNLNNKRYFTGDIGVDSFEAQKMWKGPKLDDKLVILVATRFSVHQKRQDLIVDAMEILKHDHRIKLIMVGDGPNRSNIEQRIIHHGLEETVSVIPFLPQKELWDLMQNVDILGHPCDYEGLSKIIIESMMMGLPVLGSNVLPLSDYIEDGVNGYLSDNIPEKWANKIVSIIDNKQDLKIISENAISFARNNYNADKNWLLFDEEFKQLIIT